MDKPLKSSSSKRLLQINIAHTKKQYTHYESNWRPQELGQGTSIHSRGFSSTVYRKPSKDEFRVDAEYSYNPQKHSYTTKSKYIKQRQRLEDGYRKKVYAVGLTNIGYIDIDDLIEDIELSAPTAENLHHALNGIWHYIHPSASRKPNKYRVLYRRNLTVYSDKHFNPKTREWNLDSTELGTIKAITDDNIEVSVNQDLELLIPYILNEEAKEFKRILQLNNINSSGVDLTAIQTHMHSKHLTNNGDTHIPAEIYEGKELLCLEP